MPSIKSPAVSPETISRNNNTTDFGRIGLVKCSTCTPDQFKRCGVVKTDLDNRNCLNFYAIKIMPSYLSWSATHGFQLWKTLCGNVQGGGGGSQVDEGTFNWRETGQGGQEWGCVSIYSISGTFITEEKSADSRARCITAVICKLRLCYQGVGERGIVAGQ